MLWLLPLVFCKYFMWNLCTIMLQDCLINTCMYMYVCLLCSSDAILPGPMRVSAWTDRVNKQTNSPTNKQQTNKHYNKNTPQPTNKQTNKQTNKNIKSTLPISENVVFPSLHNHA